MNTSENLQESVDLDDLQGNWPVDKEERARPDRLTEMFHSSVPVLKYLDWKVTETERGFAETILPLNISSTNQHITHQAAVILIAADYTGGIALGTLLHKVPLVGITPQKTDYGAYLWGARADIRWIRPSVEDLVCRARIPEERHEQIVKRFFGGRRVLETVRVEMTNRGELVAEANISYWVQDTYALRKNAFDETKLHVLYDHRQKTSANLIAGLRALEQERHRDDRLFEDATAEFIAGKHGIILAKRFCAVAPQIQPMVAARTKHLDDLISNLAA
ncbi:MAG TPA: methyltransferase, partial [Verrucomicrobiae bacterium]|nr:methyltransferase [Verrucomicrobiae bacterium]